MVYVFTIYKTHNVEGLRRLKIELLKMSIEQLNIKLIQELLRAFCFDWSVGVVGDSG